MKFELKKYLKNKNIKTIISDLENQKNLIISSVAGSGKTTASLVIAKYFIEKKILLLSYNRRLKDETEERVKKANLKNLEVFTIHSFAGKVANKTCKSDEKLLQIASTNWKLKKINYDIIIIDEAQDLTEVYFTVIQKILLKNTNKKYQLVLVGDPLQSIYDFKGSDSRFLTLADKLFFNQNSWIKRNLPKSFRITKNMANFINKEIYQKKVILSAKKNKFFSQKKNVFYVHYSLNQMTEVAKIIVEMILEHGENQILIISPSTKNRNLIYLAEQIRKILWDEQKQNIYIYFAKNDLDKADDKQTIENKLVFSTIHQTKGLEKKVVFFFNFDSSFYKIFKGFSDLYPCNEIYVGLTRASEYLFLMHEDGKDKIKYLDVFSLEKNKTAQIISFSKKKMKTEDEIDTSDKIKAVTNIIKFLPNNLIEKAKQKLKVKNWENKAAKIKTDEFGNISHKIKLKNTEKNIYEDVSSLLGSIVTPIYLLIENPAFFQLIIEQFLLTIEHFVKKFVFYIFKNHFENKIKKHIQKVQEKKFTKNDILFSVLFFSSILNLDSISIQQIKFVDCDFIDDKNILNIYNFFKKIISPKSEFERGVEIIYKNHKIVGSIDAIDDKNKIVYEFKFVREVIFEHFLQTMVYKYLLEKEDNKYKSYKYVIFNLRNNNSFELEINSKDNEKIIKQIFDYAINNLKPKLKEDKEFLKEISENKLTEQKFVDFDKVLSKIIAKQDSEKNVSLNNFLELNFVNTSSQNLIKNFDKNKNQFQPLFTFDKTKDFVEQNRHLLNKFIILDFETTGFGRLSEPIQIAFTIIEDGKEVEKINYYIKPESKYFEIPEFVKVSRKNVEIAESFVQVWKKIQHFFNEKYVIIAHNAWFDMRILRTALVFHKITYQNIVFFDSISFLKKVLIFDDYSGFKKSYSLENLKKFFGLDQSDTHNAQKDVESLITILKKYTNFKNFTQEYLELIKNSQVEIKSLLEVKI